MDWDQILLRKVANVSLSDSHIDKVDTTVVIGKGCDFPMLCNTPFILEISEEHFSSQSNFLHDCNFLVSYSAIREKPSLVNKNCILELNGDTIDLDLIKKLSPGAFYIDLRWIYITLMQYDQAHTNIKKRMRLPVCQDQNNEIDLLKLFNMKHSTGEWVFSLRKLRPDIPFGIRVPANFIERDVILALTCEADFIILDCADSMMKSTNAVYPLISSLSAIARVRKILAKLNNHDVTLILEMPGLSISKYLKMFALGSGLILLNNEYSELPCMNNKEEQMPAVENDICFPVENEKLERICQLKDFALHQLKLNILECGCNHLSDIGKEKLLTTSSAVKEFTEIASVYDADNVCLPCYNIKKKVKSREI